MNTPTLVRSLAVAGATLLCLAGCSFLKPSGITPRSFVLTPTSVPPTNPSPGSTNLSVGMRFVKTPAYLARRSMAMRKDRNEIVYLDTALWAERLDLGVQRVLAVNLSTLLGTDRVQISTWRSGEVSVEVDVGVEQFDVDSHGLGVLTAWWRIVAPDGEKVPASGRFSSTRTGAAPDVDPLGSAATMSALVGELAQELARAIQRSSTGTDGGTRLP